MGRSRDWDPSDTDVDADLVEYVIVGSPGISSLDQVATALAELVRSHAIRLLDVVTIVKARDGSLEVLEVDEVNALSALGEVGGYYGGFLSSHDVNLAAQAVAPETAALLLLAEDRWAGPLSVAARAAGGRVLGGERVPRSRMHPALADAIGYLGQPGPEDKEESHAPDDEVT